MRQLPEPLDGVAGDERPARRDELVGDLNEQRCQPLGRVVVGRDAVDDAHRADESRQHVHQRLLQPLNNNRYSIPIETHLRLDFESAYKDFKLNEQLTLKTGLLSHL